MKLPRFPVALLLALLWLAGLVRLILPDHQAVQSDYEALVQQPIPKSDSTSSVVADPADSGFMAASVSAERSPEDGPSILPGLTAVEQWQANEEANRFQLPVASYQGAPDIGDQTESASGGRLPPPEIRAELDAAAPVLSGVRLNKIGLARLNARRIAQGLAPLVAGRDVNVAPIGKDLVTHLPGDARLLKVGGKADLVEAGTGGRFRGGCDAAAGATEARRCRRGGGQQSVAVFPADTRPG